MPILPIGLRPPHRSESVSPVKLYAGTTEQFVIDTQLRRIAEKLRTEYVAQMGHKPGGAEFNSWQNSLTALALLINQADLTDHGVILEYQLGNTTKRLDARFSGLARPGVAEPPLAAADLGITIGSGCSATGDDQPVKMSNMPIRNEHCRRTGRRYGGLPHPVTPHARWTLTG